jgi:hypothetical protein
VTKEIEKRLLWNKSKVKVKVATRVKDQTGDRAAEPAFAGLILSEQLKQ